MNRRAERFTQVALVLGTVLVFVNPLSLGLFLPLDPDAILYILSWDTVLLSLLLLSVAFVRTKRDRYRKAFFVALPVALVALIAAEMFLSQWRIRNVHEWRAETLEGVYEPHGQLGWRPVPGGRGRHISEGNFDATYEFDSLGRKAIPTRVEGGPTLHFFGDSYTFGHGVDNQETALNLLARGFAEARGYNVANYGAMAYGIEQMTTSLRLHRDQIKPGDYVIFTPMSFDLLRNIIHKRFLCSFLMQGNKPVGSLRMRTEGRWEIATLDRACGWVENLFLQANFAFGYVYHALRDRALHAELVDNADAILAEAEQLATEQGARFFLWFIAAPWECSKQAHDFDLDDLEAKHGSMLPHCPDESLRFPGDSHWSPEGHRWYAQYLADRLGSVVVARRPTAPAAPPRVVGSLPK